MSYLNYVDNFCEEQSEENKDSVLNEALECFKNQEEKQNQELFEFIDDFIKSPEYAGYIKDKTLIRKQMKAIQCNMEDIIVEFTHQKEQMEKYPLTQEQKKMYAFKKHFENYVKSKEIEVLVEKQERSIKAIKTKISEARRVFECTIETRRDKIIKYEEHLMQKYSKKFNIELRFLTQQLRQKLLEKFRKCHNALSDRTKRRRENMIRIMEKLAFEYRETKEVQPHKIKRKVKITENMDFGINEKEVEAIKDESIDLIKEELSGEEELVKEVKEQENKPVGKEKKSKDNKEVEKKVGKKTKENNKKDKKGKPDSNKLQLPTFPITNPRKKILPENIDRMVDLIEEFRELDSQMEDRDMLQSRDYVIGDAGLIIKPHIIIFPSYEEGKKYKKTIKITNVSTEVIKLRFLEFTFPEENESMMFEVEKFGIKKLYTGSTIKFFLNFQPYDDSIAYEGNIAFVSYNTNFCHYHRFEVGVQCVPKYLDLKIYPEIVDFGIIPIWKAKDYDRVKVIKARTKLSSLLTQ